MQGVSDNPLVSLLRLLAAGKAVSLNSEMATPIGLELPLSAESQRILRDHGAQQLFPGAGPLTASHLQLERPGPESQAPASSASQLKGGIEESWIIPGGLRLLSAPHIRHLLADEPPRPRLDVEWSLDSTNTRLLERARSESIEGHCLTAEHQSAGRGRRGRFWMSPVASNLYLSMGFEFARIDDLQCLSLLVGVAVAEALRELEISDVGIKWPNDLQHRRRKLAGILIESVPTGRTGVSAVIGMGINVRVPAYVAEQIDQPYTELAAVAGADVDRNELCGLVIKHVTAMIASMRAGGRAAALQRFQELDVLRHNAVSIKIGDREVSGIARGINEVGELLVETGGAIQPFAAGEVSVRNTRAF